MKNKLTLKALYRFYEVHGDRYNYSNMVYINAHTKIEIICKEHGSFFQIANDHRNGSGCQKCSGNYIPTRPEIIDIFKTKHGNRYDYSKVEYKGDSNKVEIICKEHGSFFQRPGTHKIQGCWECNPKHPLTTEKTIERFIDVHENLYDYSKVNYINASTKVEIICLKHGSFMQEPSAHFHGSQGCPMCKSSKGEKRIESILNKLNIEFIGQHKFADCLNENNNQHIFDFYIQEKNIIIEFDGIQHYEPVEFFGGEESFTVQKMRDKQKNQYCIDKGIKIIRIPYTEINNIDNILVTDIN